VVVITHSEDLNLRHTVETLQDTLPPEHEILVVDDMSSDGPIRFLRQTESSARLVRPKRRLGVAQARNLGASRTNGRILAFCGCSLQLSPKLASVHGGNAR